MAEASHLQKRLEISRRLTSLPAAQEAAGEPRKTNRRSLLSLLLPAGFGRAGSTLFGWFRRGNDTTSISNPSNTDTELPTAAPPSTDVCNGIAVTGNTSAALTCFEKEVGWIVNGSSLSTREMDFDPSVARRGQLPFEAIRIFNDELLERAWACHLNPS